MFNKEEDFRLILEFLGIDVSVDAIRVGIPQHSMYVPQMGYSSMFLFREMRFDSSLDWLLPVIKGLQYHELTYAFDDTDVFEDLENAVGELDVEKIFKCSVSAIKWYNENNIRKC